MKWLLIIVFLSGCEMLSTQDSRQNRASNECILTTPDGISSRTIYVRV